MEYLNTKCPKCGNRQFEGIELGQKNKVPNSEGLGRKVQVHGTRDDKSKATTYKTQKIATNEAWLDQFTIDELVNYDFFFSNVVGSRLFDDYYLRRVYG